MTGDGAVLVAERDGGRVVTVAGGKAVTLIDGLGKPEGIAVAGGKLYIVDCGTKELVEHDLASGERRTLASGLPVGAPAGVAAPALRSFMPLCGAMTAMTGVAVGANGTVYVSGDMEGSVLAVTPA